MSIPLAPTTKPHDSFRCVGCRMDVVDYNGEGCWSQHEILARYARYAAEMGIVPRDLSPMEHSERGRRWVYPVMQKVIEGIEAGDAACIRLGIEFVEEDSKFAFGKILKSNTARACGGPRSRTFKSDGFVCECSDYYEPGTCLTNIGSTRSSFGRSGSTPARYLPWPHRTLTWRGSSHTSRRPRGRETSRPLRRTEARAWPSPGRRRSLN